MTNITKKIVAIVTTVTCAVWMMGPGVANALTTAELQALIDDLMAQIVALQAQLTEAEGGTAVTGCTITSFDRALKVGMSGDDVKCLQIVLNTASDTQVASSGVGSPGNETSYFGPLTQGGVIKFQEKYASDILASWGLTSGTGFVGSTTRAKLNELLSAGVAEEEEEEEEEVVTEEEEEEEVSTGPAAIALSSATPESAQIALNAQDAIFTKIKFSGGDNGVTITKVIVKRGGVSADADISAIKLYDGTTRVGSSQALNTNTHKATFSSLSWEIPAGETKVLTIKGSIAASGTATVGDSIKLGIAVASDITSSAALSGTFPIYGNTKTIAGISVGELDVDVQDAPAAATVLSGATEQEIATWKFTASSTEGVEVHSIKITHTGSATRDDISNIKIKVGGVQIGETVVQFDSQNSATFDLSDSPLSILASGVKTIYAYCDIGEGIWTSRTAKFVISQYTDVTAYGANSGGAIEITGPSNATFTSQDGQLMTIGQGTLTVTVDGSLNPASQNYVKGTENRLISAFKFSAGSREGVRIAQLKLTLGGTNAAATDISNVTLWDGSTQVGGPASVIGSNVTFGSYTVGWDTVGLFDVEKGQSKTIQVKADIPTGATTDRTVELYINAAADLYVDGLDSQYDIASSAYTVTGAAQAYTNDHTVTANGALAISKSSLTPAAQTYVIGATGKVIAKVNLTADSGEDMLISSLVVDCYQGAGSAACASTAALTNMKVLKSDGTQWGSTVSSPTASSTFSGSLTVAASQTATLSLVADVPLTSYPSTAALNISGANMTVTGASSAATITATSNGLGNDITIGEGSLTISADASPGDQFIIKGATEVSFTGFIMQAGTAEDIRVTYMKLYTCSTSTPGTGDPTVAGQASTTDASNVALYDGSTRLTTKKDLTAGSYNTYVSWSASDFLNSTGIDITKGQQKIITVKADVPSTATAYHSIAFGIASTTDANELVDNALTPTTTTDVTFVGLSSNSTPDTDLIIPANLQGVNFLASGHADVNALTVLANGTLTIEASADTPVSGMVAVGTYTQGADDVVLAKYDLTAAIEDIDVTSIAITRDQGDSRDLDFVSISLWDGSTQLGTDQSLSNSTSTFNFTAANYWTIPAGTTKVLTVKADMKGIKTLYNAGANTGDSPRLCLASDTTNLQVLTLGANSGVTTIKQTGTSPLCGNWQVMYQSKPTIAAASLPSTVLGSGEKVLYRWTVTADAKGAISWLKTIFKMSGSVNDGVSSCTIGYGGNLATQTTSTDGVYMASSTSDENNNAQKLISTSTLKVYNVATGDEVSATIAGMSVWNYVTGGSRIAFVAAAEEVIAAGATKTYELRGDFLYPGTTGDTVSVKIESISTATTTDNYEATTLGNLTGTATTEPYFSNASFVWSDKSKAGTATHNYSSADWANDYKVSGIPTATLSLSR